MPKIIGYVVFCHICGNGYDEQDPAVDFIHTDHVWQCHDEASCFDRRAGVTLNAPPGTFGGAA